jgi:hypothetical protein
MSSIKLTDGEKSYGHYVRDNGTAHTVNSFMGSLSEVFEH